MLDVWRARRRVLVRGAILAWAVLFGALHVVQVAVPDRPDAVSFDARMQLRWIAHALDGGQPAFTEFFPEGELFTWEFYGLALQNVAETTHEAEDVARAGSEVRAMLQKIDALLTHEPFDSMATRELRGGICWFAGQNLLRARLVALEGSPEPALVARFHEDSAILARAFSTSATGVLEAYPGRTWPVDSLFGYRSLQIHDALYGTQYFASFARFEETMRRAEHAPTGLMPSYLHMDGRARDAPRGCALSWSLAVLPDLDSDFAKEQWAAYKRSFAHCGAGLCLFREYPPGDSRGANSDSGPIVFGLGMSASAFALAAARAQGDMDMAESLRRTGELLGMPSMGWWGKRYVGGAVALFDIFAVWARTVPAPAAKRGEIVWTPVVVLLTVWTGIALLALRAYRRARRELSAARSRSRIQAALFAVAALALALHFAWPALALPALVAIWLATGTLGALASWLSPHGERVDVDVEARAPAD